MTLSKYNLIRAACALGLAGCFVPAHGDTVKLINGDTLTGTVVHSDERGVVLKHSLLGTMTLQTDRIAEVILGDEAEQTKTPDTEKADTKPADKSALKAVEKAALEAAAKDRAFWRRFRDDWDSRLTLGFNNSQGSTDREDYRVQFKTRFQDGAERISFDTNWYYATANGNQTQNRFQADLTKDWLQEDKPWFFFIRGQYRFDENRSWEHRTSAFGGGGYTLAKTDDVEVNTRLGFGGTYEYGSVNEFTPEALFGGSVIKWHVTDRAAISGETVYFPSLEDSTSFRVESNIEWTYKLDTADGLALKLGIENDYDSATPNEAENNDVRYYGAIVLDF